MKKQILNLGKLLNKKEQQVIKGKAGLTCDGFEMYYVNDCSKCVNILLPDAPTLGHNNCCRMAY